MKKLLFCCLLLCACDNRPSYPPEICYKGRLSLKGLCGNYVFELIDGSIDSSKLEAEWKNPETGKIYKNAFAIIDPCVIPAEIKEGDTLSFKLNLNQIPSDCVTCKAFSPTPKKALPISICP